MDQEIWKIIPEFTNYHISNHGNVFNAIRNKVMSISYTKHGHAKVTLVADWNGERQTRSIATLVAEAFVDRPNLLCDALIVLDGDFTNMRADNLAWRPTGFAWKYTRQLKETRPRQYENLRVYEVTDELYYESIVHAGMTLGLLFDDIWLSTYRGTFVYPTGKSFKIVERV